jgi:hypothetical protein
VNLKDSATLKTFVMALLGVAPKIKEVFIVTDVAYKNDLRVKVDRLNELEEFRRALLELAKI